MARTDTQPIVFVVDDDASVRKALARLIKSAGYAVATFASASEFLHSGHGNSPGCLVLDVRMPGLSGLDLQKELNRFTPPIPIIFITGHGDVPISVRAMKDGATDFLTKPVSAEALLQGIESAIERDMKARALHVELRELQQRAAALTPREREVMALVVRGLLNKQIAAELGTVEKTIKVHRARVIEKMGVASLAELVLAAEKLGVSFPLKASLDAPPIPFHSVPSGLAQ